MSTAELKVKEHPILFSGPMVRAILDGRKTQTRRIVNLDRAYHDCGRHEIMEWRNQNGFWFGLYEWNTVASLQCPYGNAGERLWVKETARVESETTGLDPWHSIEYAAGGSKVQRGRLPGKWFPSVSRNKDQSQRWHPSIFMPRWASRITLEITGVRVERLNDITEPDALAEGCDGNCQIGYIPAHQARPFSYHFAQLWESINGVGSWAVNPWVWVVEFKRISGL